MTTLEQRKAELLALGCRIYTHEETQALFPHDEVEPGDWIGYDGRALALKQLASLDTRSFNQLKREFQQDLKR